VNELLRVDFVVVVVGVVVGVCNDDDEEEEEEEEEDTMESTGTPSLLGKEGAA
jgi:hypothetical protein